MSPEARTGGELIVEALEQAGIRHCFGVPGESFLGILDALYDSSIEVISTRHEGGASFMASGYARTSGEVGVCFGTRAVGATNMAIGVHNARQDSTPMIALAGQVNRSFLGREAFQEVDLVAAMTPLAKWATQISSADMASEVMTKALHVATSGRPGPVFISVPQDVCDEVTTAEPWTPQVSVAVPYPDPSAVDRVLEALLAAERPLIFAGGGVYRSPGAGALLCEFAEAAEIPVVTSWRHHDGFPNNHPLFLGSASLGSAPTVWQRLGEADVILVLGNRMQEPSTDGYVYPLRHTRLFQADVDPSAFVNHRVPELALVSDAGALLAALLHRTKQSVSVSSERRARNAADRRRFEEATEIPAASEGDGVAYADVIRALSHTLTPETIVTSDAGNFYAWLSRYYKFQRMGTYLGPASGGMGYGLPSAIGARIARPDLPVVSLSGDGGFFMTLAELETAVRYGVAVTAIVLDNARQGTIRMHQELHHPGRAVGTELGTTDLSLVARGMGMQGFLVQDGSDFEPALRQALSSGGPSVIQVRMDREQLSVAQRLPRTPALAEVSMNGLNAEGDPVR